MDWGKNFARILSFISAAALIADAGLPHAAGAQPVFNPSYIISDADLEDYQSMNVEAIRTFLQQHGSALADMQAVDASGTRRYISEIIYNASQDYHINPKYTLVTLQKEQSLTEDPSPTQRALDWATGYGICDSCSKSDPALQKYKGIGRQIDYAVGSQRIYLDETPSRPWLYQVGQTYQVDSTYVTMLNRATAALYNYTPHLHGNQNFFWLWTRYFNQLYPDGTLLKAAGSPDVWLIEGGFKRRFSSWTSLVTRFKPELIVEVPPATLEQFQPGREIAFPQYAILRDASSGKIYLYANDTKRYMNAEAFRILGFNPDEVDDVPAADLAAVPSGPDIKLQEAYPLGAIVRSPTRELYLVQDGVKHKILDDVLLKYLFAGKKVRSETAAKLAKYKAGDPVLLPDGTLARVASSSAVFVISHGQRRPIISGEAFEELGYSWSNVHVFKQALLDAHPLGQVLAKVEPVPAAPALPAAPYVSPAPQPIELHPGALAPFPPL